MPSHVVHIVDDDPDVLDSVSFLLETDGFATTRHCCAKAFLQHLGDLEPGCILLDVQMPGMTGLQLQQHLHTNGCRMPVVIITGHGDVSSAVAAMKEGAVDYLQKPFGKADLHAALDAAWNTLDREESDGHARDQACEAIARLTRREREVVDGLARGQANKVIAYDLGVSPRTVEFYRARAMRKLGTRSLSEALQLVFLARQASAGAPADRLVAAPKPRLVRKPLANPVEEQCAAA
ncbi:response regulator transcription factor [Novosphingobium bradum]|uniref:Response regulator transcription factor n=1 Tax=Novosphingobium bradum TaxID=1737444 RepID=A0ABV7IT01_9SPHN